MMQSDEEATGMADEQMAMVNIKTELQDHRETSDIPTTATDPSQTSDSIEQTLLTRNNKFPFLRTDLEVKSQALTKAWTDLNTLLCEYKAELYKSEIVPSKYDGVTNLDQLRNELVDKENQNIQLTQQFESLQKAHEQTKMDISIKDSLLKKYQDDLLQKETLLITANTKICRLENKVKQLELRNSDSPRKSVKMSLPGVGRLNMSSALKIGAAGRPGPKLSKPQLPQPKQVNPTPTSQPSTSQSSEPIVCIEVDDDDVINDVTQAAEQSGNDTENKEQDSLYLESYSDGSGLEHSDSSFGQSQESSQLMAFNESGDYEHAEQYSGLEMETQQGHGIGDGATEGVSWEQVESVRQQQRPMLNKPFACQLCYRVYSTSAARKRHIRLFHLHERRFICAVCEAKFGGGWHLKRHMAQKHPSIIGAALQNGPDEPDL